MKKEKEKKVDIYLRGHTGPFVAELSVKVYDDPLLIGEKVPFLRLGLKWLAHLSLQLFPHLINPQFFCTAFQFPSPYVFTYSIRIASSAAVHGPFFSPRLASPPLLTAAWWSPPAPSWPPSPPLLPIILFLSFLSFVGLEDFSPLPRRERNAREREKERKQEIYKLLSSLGFSFVWIWTPTVDLGR